MNLQTKIEELHRHYCEKLQQQLPLRYNWQRLWMEWINANFSLDDLRLVLRYLLREYRAGRRNPGALKLSNLLQTDRFEEDLLLARMELKSENRGKRSSQTSCVEVEEPEEDLIERQRGLDLLRAWRLQAAARSPHLNEPSAS